MSEPNFQPIDVRFKKGIRSDGAIYFVIVRQNDNELVLTEQQAISLAEQILKGQMSEPYSRSDFEQVAALKCECVICPDCRGTGEIGTFEGVGPERCDACGGGITEFCNRCLLLEEMEQDNEEYHYRRERAGIP